MPPPGKRGKYLGFVAHEIKNPLATALWSCDLLKRMEGAERASIFGSRGKQVFVTRTNANIKFVNAIARDVAKRHPKILIQTLAYFMLIDAPEIKPENNVMVGFTPIERCPPQSSAAFKQEPAGYWYPLVLARSLAQPQSPRRTGEVAETDGP